jgi:hypothetical protein
MTNSALAAQLNPQTAAGNATRRRRSWQLYALIVIAYSVFFNFFQVEDVPLPVHLVGILIAALCLLPIRVWYAEGKQTLPMFELVCLAYLLQYGTPVYHQRNTMEVRFEEVTLSWDAVLSALLLTFAGIASMVICYTCLTGSKIKTLVPRINLSLAPRAQSNYVVLAGATGVVLFFLRTIDESLGTNTDYGAFISLLASQMYIAIAILAYQVYSGREGIKRKSRLVQLFVILSIAVLLGMATGMLENTLVPLVIFFAVRWECTRKFPWKIMLCCAVLFIVLQPVKNAYRAQAWRDGAESQPYAERIKLWVSLTTDYLSSPQDAGTREQDLLWSLRRFDLHHQFVNCLSVTPEVVPYYEGKTYEYLIYGWIPRFVWPNKPIAQEANKTLAVDYGLLHESQVDQTMTGFGHLTEAYINFGIGGVVIIMGLFGLIFAGLNLFLNHGNSHEGKAIYLSIMVFLLNGIGSNTAGILGGLLQYLVACWVILKAFDFFVSYASAPQAKLAP